MGRLSTTTNRALAGALNPPAKAHIFVDCPRCGAVAGVACVGGYRAPCVDRQALERRAAEDDALAKLVFEP